MRSSNLPLIRLEPILRQIAAEKSPGQVLFRHKVTEFTASGDCVLVTVENPDGKLLNYRAQYVVAADGGKTIGPKIGVQMEGPTGIADVVSVHFKADLSEYWDDRNFIAHFINPGGGSLLGSGSLVPMGPTWGRFSEEWTLHFGFDVNDKARWDEDSLVPRLRELLKLPELDLEVLHINHWLLERVLANKYQEGRIFIAGDAAHRHPPTTGLGLNTAIGDAHNLAWKLALVLRGKADTSLLDTYEVERRPVGKRNCDWGLTTFMNTAVLGASVGLIPGQHAMNEARFAALFEDSDMGETWRAMVRETISGQKIEFSAHDLELGYSYPVGAIVPDGTQRPAPDPLGQVYYATTRPGHRLPHAWLRVKDDAGGSLKSTHDLVGPDGEFLLITDSKGTDWIAAAAQARDVGGGIRVKVATIGTQPIHGKDIQYIDHNDRWKAICQLEQGGAILVRPDNMVGWRSIGASKYRGRELLDAMAELSGKRAVKGQQDKVDGISAAASTKLVFEKGMVDH